MENLHQMFKMHLEITSSAIEELRNRGIPFAKGDSFARVLEFHAEHVALQRAVDEQFKREATEYLL